ncbi:MAG: sel1 repeat family protein, partial [Lentisphaeria bacterium]|nr:sel1 repeat family protein [Lentisphaeria bacterium]
SAAKKSPEAMVQLAYAVENGYGAVPDPAKAFKLYAESMKKTFVPQAAVRLANYYYTGRYGVQQDIPQAIELYRKAADAGVPEALYKLGECYYSGIGVTQDCGQAFELFFESA